MRIEPSDFERNQWQKQLVDVRATDGDRPIDYQGYVLTAIADTAHVITFAVKTRALRPAEIDIPVQLSERASVTLVVNDQLIDTIESSQSSDSSLLRPLMRD